MSGEPASPVCYADQGSDAYMGYADRDEILAALNELLEAERAGARVAARSKRDTAAPMRALLHAIQGDENRWCVMLRAQILRLDGSPSRRCGAFYAKAMAIADPVERLAFLNRGQGWVVRTLGALLPRIRDEALHAALVEMRTSHIENIARAEQFDII